ncbi:hypothetical protein Salat_1848700 [Sesamum alatum]|uniref:Uncharacterized protein n=1 Tax=Sesamum alatum TaxID=300844 RepID=A0AAE1Y369_9LAMI|nr:hypothetical protein Salat_1848700 [Sesamum alatum]
MGQVGEEGGPTHLGLDNAKQVQEAGRLGHTSGLTHIGPPPGFVTRSKGIGRAQLSKEDAVRFCVLAWKIWQHRCRKTMEGKDQNSVTAWQEAITMLECYQSVSRRSG